MRVTTPAARFNVWPSTQPTSTVPNPESGEATEGEEERAARRDVRAQARRHPDARREDQRKICRDDERQRHAEEEQERGGHQRGAEAGHAADQHPRENHARRRHERRRAQPTHHLLPSRGCRFARPCPAHDRGSARRAPVGTARDRHRRTALAAPRGRGRGEPPRRGRAIFARCDEFPRKMISSHLLPLTPQALPTTL